MRMPFLTASLVSVSLGTAFAYGKGFFNLQAFILALAGMCVCHIGTNLANDYYDHENRGDWVNKTFTPLSGGSRVIQEGLLPPRFFLGGALLCFLIVACIGLYFCLTRGWGLILWGIFGLFIAYFYSAPPIWIASTGLGELATGTGLGLIPVMGSYFVQTGDPLDWHVALLSLPITLLGGCMVYINEFPDCEADREVGKNTIVVRLGTVKAMYLFFLVLIVMYLLIAILIMLRILPPAGLVIFLTIPLALWIVHIMRLYHNDVPKLLPSAAGTIQLHFIVGCLMILSIVISRAW
jgi:1,4-dihydroxy-2-naphthoate polyprenyltransferase